MRALAKTSSLHSGPWYDEAVWSLRGIAERAASPPACRVCWECAPVKWAAFPRSFAASRMDCSSNRVRPRICGPRRVLLQRRVVQSCGSGPAPPMRQMPRSCHEAGTVGFLRPPALERVSMRVRRNWIDGPKREMETNRRGRERTWATRCNAGRRNARRPPAAGGRNSALRPSRRQSFKLLIDARRRCSGDSGRRAPRLGLGRPPHCRRNRAAVFSGSRFALSSTGLGTELGVLRQVKRPHANGEVHAVPVEFAH